jgi:serine kinase of HPr protein (carbohydrate metabolism regulator)
MILHAGLVAVRRDGLWRGALIVGPSGAGKSDLALRALDAGWRLVADDRVIVWASGGAPYGRAPDALAGLIEVRGLGVHAQTPLAFAQIALCVRCLALGESTERMPAQTTEMVAGLAVPSLVLDAREASAPAKMRRGIEVLEPDPNRRI